MKKIIGVRSLAITIALIMIISSSASNIYINAETYDLESELTLNRKLSTYNLDLNLQNPDQNDITMTCTVDFEPISVNDVPVTNTAKEVVVIFDTSGSMSNTLGDSTRLEVGKTAAINFLEKLNENDLVKVSLINYGYSASVDNATLVDLSDNYSVLTDKISQYEAVGGTNIGDAIRRGNYILQNGDANADKYMVVMTDGEPTSFSYTDGKTTSTTNPSWAVAYNFTDYGNKSEYLSDFSDVNYLTSSGEPEKYMIDFEAAGDLNNYSLNYAEVMAENMLADIPTINSHYIAFTDSADANKLSSIASKSGGSYYNAVDSDAINLVYETIADEIATELTIKGVVYEETLPSGISLAPGNYGINVNGQIITKNFGSISYVLNSSKTYYVAAKKSIYVKVVPEAEGVYTFGSNNTSGFHYTDIDGNEKHEYFPVKTLTAVEVEPEPEPEPIVVVDPNLLPDYQLDILEVQPGRVFELNENDLSNAIVGVTVDVHQMSMNEFNGNIEKVNGKYDIVYIGAIEDYDNHTMTGLGENSITVDIDMTNRKALDVIEFAQSGQLLIVDDECLTMDSSKIQSNLEPLMTLSNVHEVTDFSTTTVDSLEEWYISSTHRPRLTMLDQPDAYDGSKNSFENNHYMAFIYAAFNEDSNKMETNLSMDFDGDGIFQSDEQVTHKNVNISASGLRLYYSLDETFNGLMPWKLELVDKVTNSKDYITGFSAYEGDKTVVNILQLSPGTDRMNLDSSAFVKPLETEDYEINITYMQVSDFDAAYSTWESSLNEYPNAVDGNPTVLNGNYDMIIFGFGDSYSGEGGPSTNKDLDSQAAIDAIDNFIQTGQSVIFTHDTTGPQDYVNNSDKTADDVLYNDFLNYNNTLNITANFKDDMGFNNIRTDAGKGEWKANVTTDIYKLNKGLITMYPYLLANNVSKTLDIEETKDQYWNIDLEKENVVPWFTLDAGEFKYYPEAYYFTFTNGNITYSGTGHATPQSEEEQEFFVNTILRAARAGNHVPTMEVTDLYEDMNILPSDNTVNFKMTIRDIDIQDESFTTEVYVIAENQETQVKLLSNVSKDVSFNVNFTKPAVLDDSVEDFIIKIVVTDEHGAQSVNEYNVTHIEVPSLIVEDNLKNGYLKGDTIDLTYEIEMINEVDKDLISNIKLNETISPYRTSVVNADDWTKEGDKYSISPSFSGKTLFSMTLLAKRYDVLRLRGTYDVKFGSGGDVLENQLFYKNSSIYVRTGKVNVAVSDQLGRVVEGATVQISNDEGTVVASGLTDTTGIFNVSGLTSDTYSIDLSGLPTEYDGSSVVSQDFVLNYNHSVEYIQFSVRDASKPLIETESDHEFVITGPSLTEKPIHVKVDGNGSKVIAVYTKKLAAGVTSAEANDFVGANATDNQLLKDYDSSNINDELKSTPFTLNYFNPDDFEIAGYFTATENDYYIITGYFTVTENGYYAIYALNEAGNVTVEVVNINLFFTELPGVI